MSIHTSLQIKSKLKRPRSVLTRAERLEKLEAEDRWEPSKSVFGLPKVKVIKLQKGGKPSAPAGASTTDG